MTDRCSAASRPRACSIEASDCRPTDEEKEAAAIGREHDAEREAEARRNDYYARGGDEGGRCAHASSDASRYSPMLPDNPQLKDSRRTAAIDLPLQDDPYGNAIIGAVAGGVVAGARAAAAEALAPSLGTKPIVQHLAVETGKNVAKSVAKTAVGSTLQPGETAGSEAPATRAKAPGSPASAPLGGRSGGQGTRSEIVDEPNQSVAPRYSPLLIRG